MAAKQITGVARRKGMRAAVARRRVASKTGAGKKGKAAKKASRQDLGQEVSQELLKLRPILKEIGSALVDRLDGELAGLALTLRGEGMPDETLVLPRAPILSAMLADLKGLKVKPKKGRVKDLRRIEALVDSLGTRLPPGS